MMKYRGLYAAPKWFQEELELMDEKLYCWYCNDGYFYISYSRCEKTGYAQALKEVVAKVGSDEGHPRDPDMRDLWKLYRNDTEKHGADSIFHRIEHSQGEHKRQEAYQRSELINERVDDMIRHGRLNSTKTVRV